MNSSALTPEEDVELSLIQDDANDLLRVLLGHKGRPEAGVLSHATIPLVGLVTEESFRYLSSRPQNSFLRPPNAALFDRFSHAVTKTRARIKLFDDTDGYADGLVDALAIAHIKSSEWFCDPHQGLLRSWIRRFQPDLGVFFAGEDLIATTHTILPAAGLSLDELRKMVPADLRRLGDRLFTFSYEVGAYLSKLSSLLEPLGKHIDLQPAPLVGEHLLLSHNDFIGAKVYRATVDRLRPAEQRHAGAVIMALGQINTALHVVPHILCPGSNLRLRFQALTAYHARNLLEASVPHLAAGMPAFSEPERTVLQSRELRNTCAHYGLRQAAQAAIGTEDPFGEAVQAITSIPRAELSGILERWLDAASTALANHLSKSRLASLRAFLGDHC